MRPAPSTEFLCVAVIVNLAGDPIFAKVITHFKTPTKALSWGQVGIGMRWGGDGQWEGGSVRYFHEYPLSFIDSMIARCYVKMKEDQRKITEFNGAELNLKADIRT